jgi:hypothetical protein
MSKYVENMTAVRIELLIIRLADRNGNALFFSGRDAALRRPSCVGRIVVSRRTAQRAVPTIGNDERSN